MRISGGWKESSGEYKEALVGRGVENEIGLGRGLKIEVELAGLVDPICTTLEWRTTASRFIAFVSDNRNKYWQLDRQSALD